MLLAILHHRREAEVADLDLGVVAVDEDVLALQVSVDDPRLVQEGQPVEQLPAPLLDHLALHALRLVDVPERAAKRQRGPERQWCKLERRKRTASAFRMTCTR